MPLYIKQKVFSWNDRFTVRDETGAVRYTVEGEIFSWGKKLHVFDASGNEVIFIQQKLWSFRTRFFIFINGQQAAEVVKEITFFKPVYSINGPGWVVNGDFFSHEYDIDAGGYSVARIHKEWMTWGDCYEIEMRDPRDELMALATVLAIDCAVAIANSQSN